ncbi:kinase-like protein [Teratosphaeria nubilosa]|uniref:Kinase-like protein n=1 Tax=Teratosphaeria nubilosa TaxID=161662 RepID=A0A6G1KXA8_9PEZI|nr:kinase-like protein [Teratosphaeria nubilosa]
MGAEATEGNASQSSQMRYTSRSINDTWWRRFLVRTAVKILRHWRPNNGSILFLTGTLCVKYGRLHHLPEASTMEFIARNTTIPVPKIWCAFELKDRTYIVMERVKGESLAFNWRSRSSESKAAILKQLREMIENMRRLTPPSSAVANVDGGRLWDCRLGGGSDYFGPFQEIDAFHQYIRGGFNAVSENLPPGVNELIQLHDRKWPDPVFTHGDLSSLNIMAEGDTITGIIDWETAGWFPYYWEYTTACQVNPQNTFWREEVDKFLEPYPAELHQEELRQRYFGDITW